MRHKLFVLATVASLAMFVLLIAAWVRTAWGYDGFSYHESEQKIGAAARLTDYDIAGRLIDVGSAQGCAQVFYFSVWPADRATEAWQPESGHVEHLDGSAGGGHWFWPRWRNSYGGRGGPGGEWLGSRVMKNHAWLLTVPYWMLVAVCLPFPAVGWRRWRKTRRSNRAGLCRECGYDLRATPGRCPECGSVQNN